MKRLTEFAASSQELADPSFSQAVVTWQKQHGRHTLPWQNTRDAYRVWLSEIMLQQTTVAAVLSYYERFLARFPTVRDLAAAPSEDVMALWAGLGYYTRARNLHACAKRVVAEYGGEFPSDPALLAGLPGIGRSTAAAIAAFSYGARAAILDGNVKRVFARVFGVEGYPGEKKVEDALWLRAEALLPSDEGIESYTQGLMDLGATLCTRSSPACERCPLAERCVARATGRTDELPVRKPKKAQPEKSAVLFVVLDGGDVLLEQRPESGIWGGLQSLPEMDGHVALSGDVAAEDDGPTSKQSGATRRRGKAAASGAPPDRGIAAAADRGAAGGAAAGGGPASGPAGDGLMAVVRPVSGARADEDIATAAGARFGAVEEVSALLPLVHVFTHYKLHILPYVVRVAQRGAAPAGHQWWPLTRLDEAGLPSPVRKILASLAKPSLF